MKDLGLVYKDEEHAQGGWRGNRDSCKVVS